MPQATARDIADTVRGATIPSSFLATVEQHPDQVALRWRNDAASSGWTWAEFAGQVARTASGMRRLGLEPGDRVVLMMRNRPDFHVVDLAALFCGLTPVSIYNSSSPDQIAYIAGHCGARAAFVEPGVLAERFRLARERLPQLDHVVTVDEALAGDEPADLSELAGAVTPDRIATVIYTSGTTGPPKGVLLSHGNVCWQVESLRRLFDRDDLAGKRVISYLPMAHVAERLTSHYCHVIYGYDVTTCPDPNQLFDYVVATRPQILFGVPRIWEKVRSTIEGVLEGDPERKRHFERAVAAAGPIHDHIDRGSELTSEEATTLERLEAVFRPIREIVGLGDLDMGLSGGAPLAGESVAWFRTIGIMLSESYGLSESCAPVLWEPYRPKAGTVGRPIPGCDVRLAHDGEIVARGGNIFQGYLDDERATRSAFDPDGWLHTGDIGTIDGDGYFSVVDRKKDLIITSGGKNVSPANIENALREIHLVGQAFVHGDRRPYLSALLTLDAEVAPAWARAHGLAATSLDLLAEHALVLADIEHELREVMARFSRPEQVKRWAVLADQWMPDSEVLTPTGKTKRHAIATRYGDLIDSLYAAVS